MRKWILGFVVGFLLLPVLAFFYVLLGFAPVATAAPPLPLERYMAKLALNARIRSEMPKASPLQPTEANMTAGAKIYEVARGLTESKSALYRRYSLALDV